MGEQEGEKAWGLGGGGGWDWVEVGLVLPSVTRGALLTLLVLVHDHHHDVR